jgi:hypothetical protein
VLIYSRRDLKRLAFVIRINAVESTYRHTYVDYNGKYNKPVFRAGCGPASRAILANEPDCDIDEDRLRVTKND